MQRMVLFLGVLCLLLRCTLAQTAPSDSASESSFPTFVRIESSTFATSERERESERKSEREPEREQDERSTSPAVSLGTTSRGSVTQTAVHLTQTPISRRPSHSASTPRSRSHPTILRPATPHPFPRPTDPISPTHPRPPVAVPPDDSGRSKHGPPIIAIVFGVLGGLVGLFLVFMLSRCLYSWKRTPNRDHVESLLSRHYLDREMQERERQELEQRLWLSSSISRPPPPPYQPAPAYDAVAGCDNRNYPV